MQMNCILLLNPQLLCEFGKKLNSWRHLYNFQLDRSDLVADRNFILGMTQHKICLYNEQPNL